MSEEVEIVGGATPQDQVILKLSKEGKDGQPCKEKKVGVSWHGQHFTLEPGQGCKLPREGANFILARTADWTHNAKLEIVELDAKEAKGIKAGEESVGRAATSTDKKAEAKSAAKTK